MINICRTDCVFSPDDKLIVTGVSLDRGDKEGKLIFLDRESLQTVYEIVVSDSVSYVGTVMPSFLAVNYLNFV